MQDKPTLAELLQARKFDHTNNVAPDTIYFKIDNGIDEPAVIGTAGNFVAITGLPKARKSTVIAAMVSSFVIDKPVFTFHLKMTSNKNHIAYFDTEQSPHDFNRQINTIEKLSGYTKADIFYFIDAFLLREDDPDMIIKLINEYLNTHTNTAILIIDGLLDLIDNMNDEGASKKLIRLLKRWAKKHDILILTVLHLGKKDQTSIGHIGSASDRYAQSTLLVEKTKDGDTTVSAKYLRSAKDFDTIQLHWDTNLKKYIQLKP